MSRVVVIACLAGIALAVGGLGAQTPPRGAVLIAGAGPLQDGRVVSVDLVTNTVSTVLVLPGIGATVHGVSMAEDNRAWVFSVNHPTAGGFLGRMAPSGTWTTIYRFPSGERPQSHALDVDGTVLAATTLGAVVDIDGGGVATTLYTGSALINALATEPVSGFPVWGEFGAAGHVRVFDRVLASAVNGPTIPFIRSLCVDARNAAVLIGSASPSAVLRWDVAGVTTLTASAPGDAIGHLEDGTFVVAGYAGRRPSLVRIDAAGNALQTVDLTGVFGVVRSVAAYGARGLCGTAPIAPNTSLPLQIQSPAAGDAGKPYVILPSLSRKPGLTISATKHLALNIDSLTRLALAGFLPGAPGFIGALDGQARAQASLFLPGSLRGVRVYLAGVVLDVSQPWPGIIATVTNTLAITLP